MMLLRIDEKSSVSVSVCVAVCSCCIVLDHRPEFSTVALVGLSHPVFHIVMAFFCPLCFSETFRPQVGLCLTSF